MLIYWFSNKLFNPILKNILRSPFRWLLPDNWVILTYTGRKTKKKRSLVFHVTRYEDEFIVVPGCFGELPNWWRNFRVESEVDMFYKGKSLGVCRGRSRMMWRMLCLGLPSMFDIPMVTAWELRLRRLGKGSVSW